MRKAEAFFHRAFTDTDPRDISLSYVHEALSIVDQVVDLAFENRLEVGLHLATGHFHEDSQRHSGAGLDFLEVRSR